MSRSLRRRVAVVFGVVVVLVATLGPVPRVAATVVNWIDDVELSPSGERADPGTRAYDAGAATVGEFRMVALSWNGPPDAALHFRVRTDGHWDQWVAVHPGHAGPDPAEEASTAGEGTVRTHASEPYWVGHADGLQVQAADGATDVVAHLARERTETRITSGGAIEPAGAAPDVDGGPTIRSRAEWGAMEPRRTYYAGAVNRVVLHHTVNRNDYTPADVPAMIRSVQRYHQISRGWNDIAYNFVVDRFGGIWEARAGGVTSPVLGGHTKGFNTGTVGIAVLGDFNAGGVPEAVVDAVAHLAGWRLAVAGVDPLGSGVSISAGNPIHAEGAVVEFPATTGHKDNTPTSCPGVNLYAQLDRIRAKAAAHYDHVFGSIESLHRTPGGATVSGFAIDRSSTDPGRVLVTVDGGPPAVVVADVERPDLVERFGPGTGGALGFEVPLSLGEGGHRVCVTALDNDRRRDAELGCQDIQVRSSAIGSLERVVAAPGGVTVTGWALDPDADDPIEVVVRISGPGGITAVGIPAFGPRGDVAAAYPGYGPHHGFAETIPLAAGTHEICAIADNVGPGDDQLFGCGTVTVSDTLLGHTEAFRLDGGRVTATGWSIDPAATGATEIRVVVDGTVVATQAAAAHRPDVGAVWAGFGPHHGFSVSAEVGDADRVCVDAVGATATVRLACTP